MKRLVVGYSVLVLFAGSAMAATNTEGSSAAEQASNVMQSGQVQHNSFAKQQLQKKLASIRAYRAKFKQTVYDNAGHQIANASGVVEIARPDKFRWQSITPAKQMFVSDGKDLWIDDPDVDQVTVMNLADAVTNTPFLLISSGTDKFWQDYNVIQSGNSFTVASFNKAQVLNKFTVTFDRRNNVTRFEVFQAQGQHSAYVFSDIEDNPKFANTTFEYVLRTGVEVDDQRR